MRDLVTSWVTKLPYGADYSGLLASAISMALIFVGAAILYILVKQVLLLISHKVVTKSEFQFDDVFVKWGVLGRAAYLAPPG